MHKDWVSAVKAAYSGPAARLHVAAISRYHRIQASPGYRAAAEYCLGQLCSWGVEAEIHSFPADDQTSFWTCRAFQEWEATEATLDLLLPAGETQRLADYREDKISLIQRSLPFAGEAEVVALGKGDVESEYEGLDVAGKVVLVQGDIREVYRLAVQERGALGVLFDGMRESPPVRQRIDLPDARQYTSFWWRAGDEPKCFGFVLTPRQGDELRALARQRREKGQEALRVRAKVVSRLYDGAIEVVSALIRGRTDREVVIVAHLCHPQASANDNASGAAAALEAAHALHALIGSGCLPVPERSIRLLWVPEMTGTYAYLATHEDDLARMVAGINLDMVGQNQALCGSSLLIERPPEAMASFAGDLAEALQEALQEGVTNLAGTASYPLYRHAITPFSGGSDHYILSDPTVGVPAPMLIQWPDKFYHTSEDTLDKVDPGMLAVTGGLATAYAYFVATAGETEARWLGREIVARARGRLACLAQESYLAALAAKTPEALGEIARRGAAALAFRGDRTVEALASLARLADGLDEAVAQASLAVRRAQEEEWLGLQLELKRLARALGVAAVPEPAVTTDEWSTQAEKMILRRRFRGPISLGDLLAYLDPGDRALLHELSKTHPEAARALPEFTLYWMDGQRNLREIADLTECEVGKRDVEFMVKLAELMIRAGLLEGVAS